MKKSVFMSALVASSLAFSGVQAIGPDTQEEKQGGCWSKCTSCFKKTRQTVDKAADALSDGARSVAAIAQWGAELAQVFGAPESVQNVFREIGDWSKASQTGLDIVKRLADEQNKSVADELTAGIMAFKEIRANPNDNPEEQALAAIKTLDKMLTKVDTGKDAEAQAFVKELQVFEQKATAAVQKVNEAADVKGLISDISVAAAGLVGRNGSFLQGAFGYGKEWSETLTLGSRIMQRLKVRSTPALLADLEGIKGMIQAAKDADAENPHQQVLAAMHMFDVMLAKANTGGDAEVEMFVRKLANLRQKIQSDMGAQVKAGTADVADVKVELQDPPAVPVVPQFVDVPMLQPGAGVQPVVTGSIVPVPAVGANGGTTQV